MNTSKEDMSLNRLIEVYQCEWVINIVAFVPPLTVVSGPSCFICSLFNALSNWDFEMTLLLINNSIKRSLREYMSGFHVYRRTTRNVTQNLRRTYHPCSALAPR